MFPELLILILFIIGLWWAYTTLRVPPTRTGSSSENHQQSLWQKVPKILTQPHLHAHGFSADQAGSNQASASAGYARYDLAGSASENTGIADSIGGNKNRSSNSGVTAQGERNRTSDNTQGATSQAGDIQSRGAQGTSSRADESQLSNAKTDGTQGRFTHSNGNKGGNNQSSGAYVGGAQAKKTQTIESSADGADQSASSMPTSPEHGSGVVASGSTSTQGFTATRQTKESGSSTASNQPQTTRGAQGSASNKTDGIPTDHVSGRAQARASDSSHTDEQASGSETDTAASDAVSVPAGSWASRPLGDADENGSSDDSAARLSAEIARQAELNRQLQARLSELENERHTDKKSRTKNNDLPENVQQSRSGQSSASEIQSLTSAETDPASSSSNLSGIDESELRRLQAQLAIQQQQNEKYLLQIDDLKSRLHTDASTPATSSDTSASKARKKNTAKAPRKPLFQRPVEQDDLKQVSGIGPVMERTLNELGVSTFKQLAEFTSDDVQMVSDALEVFPGRIERDKWVDQAGDLYRKKYLTKA